MFEHEPHCHSLTEATPFVRKPDPLDRIDHDLLTNSKVGREIRNVMIRRRHGAASRGKGNEEPATFRRTEIRCREGRNGSPLMKLVIRAETTTDIQDAYTYIGN